MSKSDKLLYTFPHVFFITTARQQLLKLVGQARVEGKPYFKQLIRSILMLKVFLFLFMQERDGVEVGEEPAGNAGGQAWGLSCDLGKPRDPQCPYTKHRPDPTISRGSKEGLVGTCVCRQ